MNLIGIEGGLQIRRTKRFVSSSILPSWRLNYVFFFNLKKKYFFIFHFFIFFLFKLIMKLLLLFLFFFIFLFTYFTNAKSYKMDFEFEHKLGNEWKKRGKIEFISPIPFKKQGTKRIKIKIENYELTEKDKKELIENANKEGYYSIRVPTDPHSKSKASFSIASIKAYDLLRSNGQDQIILHFDNNEKIIGVDYITNFNYDKNASSKSEKYFPIKSLKTTGFIDIPVHGATVNLNQGYGSEFRKMTDQPEEKSFFKKYWFIIIPVLLLVCMGGLQ
ncbi:er membrane protein complex subunit 10 [Anaeramoeba ignava]|uniref:ER membrane protein complex subunit 10 n=1 Tax=Anaeramoeba ignava TaxID=1746090 RepID=A0A9Q0LGC3_ANAIG|nr:er membrane protein complex subunit 10 [Anaeramoeba ignava]